LFMVERPHESGHRKHVSRVRSLELILP
jgi:hypothetical protein